MYNVIRDGFIMNEHALNLLAGIWVINSLGITILIAEAISH